MPWESNHFSFLEKNSAKIISCHNTKLYLLSTNFYLTALLLSLSSMAYLTKNVRAILHGRLASLWFSEEGDGWMMGCDGNCIAPYQYPPPIFHHHHLLCMFYTFLAKRGRTRHRDRNKKNHVNVTVSLELLCDFSKKNSFNSRSSTSRVSFASACILIMPTNQYSITSPLSYIQYIIFLRLLLHFIIQLIAQINKKSPHSQ